MEGHKQKSVQLEPFGVNIPKTPRTLKVVQASTGFISFTKTNIDDFEANIETSYMYVCIQFPANNLDEWFHMVVTNNYKHQP